MFIFVKSNKLKITKYIFTPKHKNITMDKQPFKNILWKAPFTARTTSVSNRFWSPSLSSWPTKKLFSIAFASVHPIIIKTFHYYYNHIIEINLFSIYIIFYKVFLSWTEKIICIECGNRTFIKSNLLGYLTTKVQRNIKFERFQRTVER